MAPILKLELRDMLILILTTIKKKSLSVGQKRAIKIGAAAVSTALSAYGTYKLVQSEKLDGLISSGKDAVNKFLKRNASQTVDTISDAKTADFLRKMDPSNFKSEKFDIPRVKLSDRAKMHSEAIRNMEKISKVASPTGKQNLAKRIEYSKAAIEEEKNIALKKARENLTDRERNALRGIDSWQRLLKNTKDPAKREIIQKRIRFLLRSSQEK